MSKGRTGFLCCVLLKRWELHESWRTLNWVVLLAFILYFAGRCTCIDLCIWRGYIEHKISIDYDICYTCISNIIVWFPMLDINFICVHVYVKSELCANWQKNILLASRVNYNLVSPLKFQNCVTLIIDCRRIISDLKVRFLWHWCLCSDIIRHPLNRALCNFGKMRFASTVVYLLFSQTSLISWC